MMDLRKQIEIPELQFSQMLEFIATAKWQFAKTYARTFPHEYTSRKWQENEVNYQVFAERLVEYGFEELWKERFKTACIEIDGYKYWIMATPAQSVIMNRKPVAGYTEDEIEAKLEELARAKAEKEK